MLGGVRERVPVGVSVGIEPTLDDLLAQVEGFVAEGYGRVKLKIKPGWDVAVVRAVRERWPDLPLQVDANSAYTLADAPHLAELDAFDLLLIEQPLHHDDMVDHAVLQRQLKTPICLDESIHSPEHARWALDIDACRVINIKVGRVGGFTAAKQIHDLCAERGVPVWCGGMLETNIGRGRQPGAGGSAQLHPARRHLGFGALLRLGPRRAEFRAQRRLDDHRAERAGTGRARDPGAAGRGSTAAFGGHYRVMLR